MKPLRLSPAAGSLSAPHSMRSAASESRLQLEIERCYREIAELEQMLMSGHPDVEGLYMALAD